MDVRLRFKKEFKEYTERTCIVVIDILDVSIGLIVDSVSEVLTIPEEDVVNPPKINKEANNRYIKGIGKVGNEVRLILDCEKLLTEEELNSLAEVI
jgi:purine-binding chemotaxis protein CheW